jgi:hypothetical protein
METPRGCKMEIFLSEHLKITMVVPTIDVTPDEVTTKRINLTSILHKNKLEMGKLTCL